MAHLCSAHRGRKAAYSKKDFKLKEAPPLPPRPRDDEYGFLPWRLGIGSLPRACTKGLSPAMNTLPHQNKENIHCKMSRPYSTLDAPKKQRPKCNDEKSRPRDPEEIKRVRRVPVSDIVNIFCPIDRDRSKSEQSRTRGRRCILQTQTRLSETYPKSYEEFVQRLEAANQRKPANIPIIVTTDYNPPKQFVNTGVITVKKGTIVNGVYKSQDWIFVVTPENKGGYVPYECLDPIGLKREVNDFSQQYPDPSPVWPESTFSGSDTSGTTGSPFPSPTDSRHTHTTSHNESLVSFCADTTLTVKTCASDDSGIQDRLEDSPGDVFSETFNITELSEYLNDSHIYENLELNFDDLNSSVSSLDEGKGEEPTRLTVLFDYVPIHDHDVPVRHQEVVTLIYDGEESWVWVEKDDGSRGFIPRRYAIDLTVFNLDPETQTTYL